MPAIPTLAAYRAIYHRDDIWRPLVEEIGRRHDVLRPPYRRAPDGSHIVYFAGDEHVIKLFTPLFPRDFTAERLAARYLAGKLGVELPRIVAEGALGEWPYLVLTRISGEPLETVWATLRPAERERIAAQVGELIARLRALPITAELDPLRIDWPAHVAARIAAHAAHHPPVAALNWEPRGAIADLFAALPDLGAEPFRPTLLLADITREHIFVQRGADGWRMTGYLDFGDAMVGPADYELVAPGLELGGGDPDCLRALLLGAGFAGAGLNERLSRRLMAYTLLHRFVELTAVVALVPGAFSLCRCGGSSPQPPSGSTKPLGRLM